MLKPSGRHLTEDELDAVASFNEPHARSSIAVNAPTESISEHLLDCQHCRQQLDARMTANNKLSALKNRPVAEPGNLCQSDEEWMKVAAGLVEENVARQMLDHAADCDHCGPALNRIAEDFSDSTSNEESRFIANLSSNSANWQARLAAQLGASNQVRPREFHGAQYKRRPFSAWRWATAGLTLVTVAAWSGWMLLPRPEIRVQRLIEEAYTERRSMEMRLPGAAFGPVRVERGERSSRLDNPPALLEAEALIARKLAERPADPFWLQNRARTELLEGDYSAALQNLQRALTLQPKSAPLLVDTATAYYQRGAALDQPADFGHAIELLGQSLILSPRDQVALFNRAIVAERLFLYSQAAEDWRDYLNIDGSGPWADEARERLKHLQDKLRKNALNRNTPLLGPAALERKLAGHPDDPFLDVDHRIEEYYHVAILEWLPDSFPMEKRRSGADLTEINSALSKLRGLSSARHGDDWIRDLLSHTEAKEFSVALLLLSQAKRSNEAGDFNSGLKLALAARKQFRSARNTAGEMRAALEEVYALRLTQDGTTCIKRAQKLANALSRTHYNWLSIQTRLELAMCHDVTGNPTSAADYSRQAMRAAEKFNYAVSYLRALLISSVLSSPSTSSHSKWSSDLAGLSRFWTESYPSMVGYNFYTDMDSLAEKSGQPHLEIAILRQATETLGPDPDLLLRAVLHSRLGAAAISAGLPAFGWNEYAESDRLFRQVPDSGAARSGQVEAQTWLARIEALQGNYLGAERRLSALESSTSKLSNQYVVMNFYQTLADVRIRAGQFAAADRPARASIALAEHELQALSSNDDRLSWNHEAERSYKTLVESYLRKGDTLGSLELWEWYLGTDFRTRPAELARNQIQYFDKRYSTMDFTTLSDPPTLPTFEIVSEKRKRLRNQTVVTYAIFPGGVAVWGFDDRGIETHWITIEETSLREAVHQYIGLCSDPRSDLHALTLKSRQLYDLLIAPVSDRISENRTLVIEPDGILSSLPFATLIRPSGHYLIDLTPIVISPGLYYSLGSRPSFGFNETSKVLAVGAPALGTSSVSELRPLPDANIEAQSVAVRFRHSHVLSGTEATLLAVRSSIDKIEVFHFAGHSIASPGNAALLLAPGDNSGSTRLDAEKLGEWHFRNLQLVVLSACGTENSSGETLADPENLVFVFLRAGIPHVVATRWNLDSVSAKAMVDDFYSHLLLGESVPQAMRAASTHLRRDPVKNHPYFWAAFDCFGRS